MGTQLPRRRTLSGSPPKPLVYTRAYSNSTYSLPSHASLLTGLLPYAHRANHGIVQSDHSRQSGRTSLEVGYRPLSDDFVTIPEYLSAAGMPSALVSANYGYLSPAFGLDQGFDYVGSNPQNLLRVESVAGPILRNQPWAIWRSLYGRLSQKPLPAPRVNKSVLSWLAGC